MKIIDISTPKYPNAFTMVDDEDFERISAYKWCVDESPRTRNIYAKRSSPDGRSKIRMHREILRVGPGAIVDHKDRNGLNNQKENLRLATASQNGHNCFLAPPPNKSSKYRGVCRYKRLKRETWIAKIKTQGRAKHLGYFSTQEAAYAAYLEAAKEIYGEFMPTELVADLPMIATLTTREPKNG